VCASQSAAPTGGLDVREETERKIMSEAIRAKADEYLEEVRQKAFIEYR
jgi:hypothetical protein